MKFKKNFLPQFFLVLLFLIPFFWLKPGELDLGGDASRLYFYDPLAYIKNLVLYVVSPQGSGPEFSYQFSLPYNLLLLLFKQIINSTYLLITLFNSLILTGSFLAIYAIVYELLSLGKNNKVKDKPRVYLASIFAGLFYVFSPISIQGGWDLAQFSQTAVFTYPLVFWLLLRYINTSELKYLLFSLLVSFLFSPNFSYSAAPKFSSFFLLAIPYLAFYSLFIRKIKLKIKTLVIMIILFITLHAFHIFPQLSNLYEKGSAIYYSVVSSQGKKEAINYFMSLTAYVKLSENILAVAPLVKSYSGYEFISIIFPAIIIIGAIFNQKIAQNEKIKSKNYTLLLLFLLIALFLITGKITDIGLSIYKALFNLPGFLMFRSYFGQWAYTFIFFYSLVLGHSIYCIFSKLKNREILIIYMLLIFIITIAALPLIKGEITSRLLTKSSGISIYAKFKMDPDYEKVINYIKTLSIDGKFLTLPLADHFYQIAAGDNNSGAYLGPSTIAYLTGKNDFGSSLILKPFSDIFLKKVQEKEEAEINNIFPLLNIKYLFYNSDPYIYDLFPDFPYQQMKTYLPKTQKEYQTFIDTLPFKKKSDFGDNFHFYEIDDKYYLPHLYIAKEIFDIKYDFNESGYLKNDLILKKNITDAQAVFLDNEDKNIRIKNLRIPKMTFYKINPTKYEIIIQDSLDPFILVFSQAFNSDWKVFVKSNSQTIDQKLIISEYFNGEIKEMEHSNNFLDLQLFETWVKKPLADDRHLLANGYANAWYIKPSDVNGKKTYTLILEMTAQRIFYISLLVSFCAFMVCVIWLVMLSWATRKMPNIYEKK